MKTVIGLMALIAALTFSIPAQASLKFFNSSGQDLGIMSEFKCSTGVTCTISGGKLNMVSSPTLVAPLTLENAEIINNTVDDTVEILSNDEHTTLQLTGFEAKDAIFNMYADQGDDTADKFSLKYSAAGLLTFNINGSAYITHTGSTGAVAMTGPLTGDGGDALSGFLNKQVAATATTITAAQCGSSFINTGAVAMNLPEASTVLGCRLTFIVGNASNFDINPDDADIILPFSSITPSAGDSVRSATLGVSVTLEAISASQWAVVAGNGAYTDIN